VSQYEGIYIPNDAIEEEQLYQKLLLENFYKIRHLRISSSLDDKLLSIIIDMKNDHSQESNAIKRPEIELEIVVDDWMHAPDTEKIRSCRYLVDLSDSVTMYILSAYSVKKLGEFISAYPDIARTL
jgi:hypothetical protein